MQRPPPSGENVKHLTWASLICLAAGTLRMSGSTCTDCGTALLVVNVCVSVVAGVSTVALSLVWCGVHRFAVLKGVDDVKDTVRAAAVGALKTVGKLTVQPLLDTLACTDLQQGSIPNTETRTHSPLFSTFAAGAAV